MFFKETITRRRERERQREGIKQKDKQESGGDKRMIILHIDVNNSTFGLLTVRKLSLYFIGFRATNHQDEAYSVSDYPRLS